MVARKRNGGDGGGRCFHTTILLFYSFFSTSWLTCFLFPRLSFISQIRSKFAHLSSCFFPSQSISHFFFSLMVFFLICLSFFCNVFSCLFYLFLMFCVFVIVFFLVCFSALIFFV